MLERLAVGAAQFGLHYGIANQSERVSKAEVERILFAARQAGVDTLDTAIAYGDSEQVLGEVGVSGWKVVTKLPAVPLHCADIGGWVESELTRSLRRLRTSQLHAVLLHRPGQLLGREGGQLLNGLLNAKRQGLTAKVGVSIYNPEEIDELLAFHPFDLVQAPFSILDQRIVKSGVVGTLQEQGVELQTRSTFLQGLLLMPAEKRPAQFARWGEVWLEWDRWLQENKITAVEACLRFALSRADISRAVVGFDTAAHFEEAARISLCPLNSVPVWPEFDPRLLNPSYWSKL
jgi:aryl-alcohol dehydrogenase-like predicted oxidoreductase